MKNYSNDNVKRLLALNNIDLNILSKSIKTLFTVSADRQEQACATVVAVALSFLHRRGFSQAKVAFGESAWRIDGKNANAVIAHSKRATSHCDVTTDMPTANYHAWIQISPIYNLDLTTYQLPMKAEAMDKIDGEITPVNWAPDYLCFSTREMGQFETVRDSYKSGEFWYLRDDNILDEHAPLGKTLGFPTNTNNFLDFVDPADVDSLEVIYDGILEGSLANVSGLFGNVRI
ncbi:hypothetical protein V6259_17985 [Marinomonas sp. TI.3.20]|uniref:hypothetical protein n=1 Tax=Marinomonas sp. TI.3.20 TaxID=3121296 RepID=UPI00311F2F61